MTMNRDLNREMRRVAAHYRDLGFDARDSILLAAERADPYRHVKRGEFRFARHYVPSEFRYQNPNEWNGRNRH